MIPKLKKRFNNYQFSNAFLYLASTLVFIPAAIYLRYVIGTYLILDKHYPDFFRMALVLNLFVFLWLSWKWIRDRKLILTGLELYLGIFIFIAFVSTLFSENLGLSLEKLVGVLSYIVLVYFLLDIRRNKYLWQGIIYSLLFTAAASSLLILISLIPYLKGYQFTIAQLISDPIYWYKVFPRVPFSDFLHPSVTAGYLLLIIPLAFYQLIQTRNVAGKIFQGLGIILYLIVLLLTKSRGGFLGLGLMILVVFLLYRKEIFDRLSKSKYVNPISIVIFAGVGIGIVILIGRTRGFDLAGKSIQARFQLWEAAWKMIRNHPLLGSGLGAFGQEYIKFRDPSFEARSYIHAHNQMIQITVELGLLGLLSLALIAWKYYCVIKKSTREMLIRNRFLLIGLSGLFGALIPDAIFTSSTIVFLLIFYLVWLLPQDDSVRPGKYQIPLVFISIISVLVGTGAGWIVWKIKPYYQASIEAVEGNWAEATRGLETALDRDPHNDYYHYLLGYTTGQQACKHGQDFSTPISHYLESQNSYPGWDISHANLAALYAESGDFQNAAAQMELAIQAYPFSLFYQCLLGDYYWELGRENDALEAYSACVVNEPRVLDTSYWIEDELHNNLQEAVIAQAKTIMKTGERDLVKESEFSYYSGEFEEALSSTQSYLESNPTDKDAFQVFLKVQEVLGILPDHEEELDMMLNAYPDFHILWMYKGKLALLKGNMIQAERALRISVLRKPTYLGYSELGSIYQDWEDLGRSETMFREALRMIDYQLLPFSRHVASRWPFVGVYNQCHPDIFTYSDYIDPALDIASKLENTNCKLALCFYNKLENLTPHIEEAQTQIEELVCSGEFDPEECLTISPE